MKISKIKPIKWGKIPRSEKLLIAIVFSSLILIVGITLNFLAITKNGGRMPFYTTYYSSTETHFSFTDFNEVNYPYLTDIINFPKRLYFSIGDAVILIGATLGLSCAFLLKFKISFKE